MGALRLGTDGGARVTAAGDHYQPSQPKLFEQALDRPFHMMCIVGMHQSVDGGPPGALSATPGSNFEHALDHAAPRRLGGLPSLSLGKETSHAAVDLGQSPAEHLDVLLE